MKLKIILSVILTFLLVACPTKRDDIYVDVYNFHVKVCCSDNKGNAKDTIVCSGNEFKIELNFEITKVANMDIFSNQANTAYASYQRYYFVSNKVINYNIVGMGNDTLLNKYFDFCLDKTEYISELPVVEAINETVILKYLNGGVSPYFKLKTPISYDGKFIVQLELSDGRILSDTTQNVILEQ